MGGTHLVKGQSSVAGNTSLLQASYKKHWAGWFSTLSATIERSFVAPIELDLNN